MRRTVVAAVAVVTATSVFTLIGLGVASAAAQLPASPAGATATGTSPMAEAATLKALHDQLADQSNANDTAGMRVTQAALATELAKLQTPAGHAAMAPGALDTVDQAQQANNQLGLVLAQLSGQHGQSASDLPVPGLGSLITVVQSVLALVLSIVTGLLGGLPVPSLPVPTTLPGV